MKVVQVNQEFSSLRTGALIRRVCDDDAKVSVWGGRDG
jgi:hypothetical protein